MEQAYRFHDDPHHEPYDWRRFCLAARVVLYGLTGLLITGWISAIQLSGLLVLLPLLLLWRARFEQPLTLEEELRFLEIVDGRPEA